MQINILDGYGVMIEKLNLNEYRNIHPKSINIKEASFFAVIKEVLDSIDHSILSFSNVTILLK